MCPPSSSRRAFLAACGSGALVGLAGCTSARAEVYQLDRKLRPRDHRSDADLSGNVGPWPTLGHDARRSSHRQSALSLDSNATVERIAPAGLYYEMPPALSNGTLFFGVDRRGYTHENDGQTFSGFVAHDAQTGEEQWRVAEERGMATPTVVGETVFLTSAGRTRAINRRTGELHWTYKVGYGYPNVSPAVVGDQVYACDDHVYALDAITGEKRWQSERALNGTFGTAATERVVCATSGSGGEGGLYAFDPADGSLRWKAAHVGECYAPPVIHGETVVAVETDGTINAVSLTDGTERWTRNIGSQLYTPPAVGRGALFMISDAKDTLFAFDIETGEQRWVEYLGPVIEHTPAVADDTLYVAAATNDGTFFAYDTATGDERWHRSAEVDPSTGPILGDDTIYFGVDSDGSKGGGVYALG